MNKQAILIIAHNNIEILKKQLELFDNENIDIFLHIDKKSNISYEKIRNITKKSKLYFYKKLDIRWAHYSQVQCELFLIKEALQKNNYEYLHLISGVDMPLKNIKEIYSFFHKNYGKEFVHFQSEKLPNNKYSWVKYYRFMKNKVSVSVIDKLLLKIQKMLKIDRTKKYKKDFKIMTGANWFSITDKFANYLISKEKEIKKVFKLTRSPDELFLQTIIYNSKFRENIYNQSYNDNYDSCKRLIDWDRGNNKGNPYVWKIEDKEIIEKSACFFARKFDYKTDRKIIEYLYDKLK